MKNIFFQLFIFLAIISCHNSKNELPNIIFIMADDLGSAELGSYGQKNIITPNIDNLSLQGMSFTQAYSGSSVCAPARSVLMTGLHTGHTRVRGNFGFGGVTGLGGKEGRVPLKKEDVTFVEILKDNGYKTGMIGKWGLGEPNTSGEPNKKGFDYFFGFLNQRRAHSYYPDYLWENSKKLFLENNDGKGKDYSHNLFLKKTLSFIEKNRNSPFFLYLPLCIPHSDYEIPQILDIYKEKKWMNKQKIYASMVSTMDNSVGKIMEKLKDLDIDKNTYVFFTSDNGAAQINDEWKIFKSNGILKGKKRDPYEGGIRVPLIVRNPSMIKKNSKSDIVTYFPDFFPTILELINVNYTNKIDGLSIAPTLLGENQNFDQRYLYWEFYEKNGWKATRFKNWKAIKNNIHFGTDQPIELYNLINDPSEETNLSSKFPDIIKKAEQIFSEAHYPSENWFWKFQNSKIEKIYNQ